MTNYSFIKMHGLGNDFVLIDGRAFSGSVTQAQIKYLCDRRRGIGCDQLILLEPPSGKGADIKVGFYNSDGSESGACGNGSRCVAAFMMDEMGRGDCRLEVRDRFLSCTRDAGTGLVTVDMGPPEFDWRKIPLSHQCDTMCLPLSEAPVGISMGNPHCVYFCDNAEDMDVEILGPKAEHDPLFPEKTNVEYVSMLGENHLRMRVWERGAGMTQACGTGACAAAAAAIRRGLTGRQVRVTLDGGDLWIDWRENDNHIYMTGPVAKVFEGSISFP